MRPNDPPALPHVHSDRSRAQGGPAAAEGGSVSRGPASNAISVLRGALSGPYPSVRRAAERLIQRALKAETFGDACAILGVPRRGLERLREDFPEAFDPLTKSTEKRQ